jgi:4-amino-4-deoxy-L-arabinose transferase-like glycosyltransferase
MCRKCSWGIGRSARTTHVVHLMSSPYKPLQARCGFGWRRWGRRCNRLTHWSVRITSSLNTTTFSLIFSFNGLLCLHSYSPLPNQLESHFAPKRVPFQPLQISTEVKFLMEQDFTHSYHYTRSDGLQRAIIFKQMIEDHVSTAFIVYSVNEAARPTQAYVEPCWPAFIPKPLVALLTILIAVGGRAIVKANVIARVQLAIEAVGGVTNIYFDNTNTLTQGRMVEEDSPHPWYWNHQYGFHHDSG